MNNDANIRSFIGGLRAEEQWGEHRRIMVLKWFLKRLSGSTMSHDQLKNPLI